MESPFLIGPHLYLRPLEKADAPVIQNWVNDPDIRRTLRSYHPLNQSDEEKFIERAGHSEHDLVLMIVRKDIERSVGTTGLHHIDWKNRHAEFGIMIGILQDHDQGFGTEATRLMLGHAFDTMNLNRIHLQVYEFNLRAVHVYDKVGFKSEGVLRQHHFQEGRWWDTLVMSILADEWRQQQRAED